VLETDDATACLSASGLHTLSFWAICLPGFDGLAACTLQVDINKGNPNGTPKQFILVSTWKEYSFQFQVSDSPLSVGLTAILSVGDVVVDDWSLTPSM
jgi:hypothetical protein